MEAFILIQIILGIYSSNAYFDDIKQHTYHKDPSIEQGLKDRYRACNDLWLPSKRSKCLEILKSDKIRLEKDS